MTSNTRKFEAFFSKNILSYGVMVALQFLDLPV